MNLREMDENLATVVMGWKRMTYGEEDPDTWGSHEEFAAKLTDYWHTADGVEVETAVDNGEYEDVEYSWKPTEVPADSKMLRAKLAEKWDWLIGHSDGEKPFGFALYNKGAMRKPGVDPKEEWIGEADTEELAVAVVACKAFGIEVAE